MIDQTKDPQKESRNRRLSAALRDNLKRRKTQARGRDVGRDAGRDTGHDSGCDAASAVGQDVESSDAPAGAPTETHDSAGFAKNNQRNS